MEKFPEMTFLSSSSCLNFTEKIEKSKQKAKKSSCPFCEEQKKRPLSEYLRQRSKDTNANQIREEDEEDSHCHSAHGARSQKKPSSK